MSFIHTSAFSAMFFCSRRLYFKEKDLERNGYDMLDITEAYPEYDFVERESDGRLVFHLNDEK